MLIAKLNHSTSPKPIRHIQSVVMVDTSQAYPPGDEMKIDKWWTKKSSFSGAMNIVTHIRFMYFYSEKNDRGIFKSV